MKKILLSTLAAVLLSGCAMCANSKSLDILTLFSTKSYSQNKAWVGTFQLVWNDMKNNIIKKDIKFIGEKPTRELIGLNNEEFNSTMLNDSSYYTSYGKTTPLAKEQIKNDIFKKFSEKSDILDMMDWSEGIGKYYAYAMLKKEFEFFEAFDKLEKTSFNNSKEKYDFFGIKEDSKEILDNNVGVLFYNNKNDFALQLRTQSNDIVYLYRTNSNNAFDKLYEKMIKKSEKYQGNKEFAKADTLKVPNLKINSQRKYPTLTNKQIEGTDLYFSDAIETLQLELDNKGGKVKSEAMIMTKNCLLHPEANIKPREFNFDKTFVMFLADAGKENPYLALRIKDLSEFQKGE